MLEAITSPFIGIRERVQRFRNKVYKTKHGLLINSVMAPYHNNVIAVLRDAEWRAGARPLAILGKNIVTDAGDLHYAEDAAGESNTNAFGVLVLGTGSTSPAKTNDFSNVTEISASEKSHDSGYPTTNDSDSDNTGSGTDIVTYLTSYTKGDFNNTGISEGCITNATPGTSEPLLTHYQFSSSFDKTSDDTLKVFTNHEMKGV